SDHPAIVLAILHEAREVVIEGQVDDAIGAGRTLLEAVGVGDRAAIGFGARSLQVPPLLLRPIDTDHLMARRDQIPDNRRPDEAGRAGHKYTHGKSPEQYRRQNSAHALSY